jgi:ElaB/YqjD/DUF883 family membrane-anchored ribosome-binding protein
VAEAIGDLNDEQQMVRLMANTKDLLFQLRDAKDPEICRLRKQVSQYIAAEGRSKSNRGSAHSLKVTRVPGSLVRYVQEHPWLALLTAVSVSWTLSHLSTASRD